jgi:hypothetical protein
MLHGDVQEPSPNVQIRWKLGFGDWRLFVKQAVVAQSVEHVHGKDGVTGSNPVNGSERKSPKDEYSYSRAAYFDKR